jgi:uncharacterized protein (TIGR03435 family)
MHRLAVVAIALGALVTIRPVTSADGQAAQAPAASSPSFDVASLRQNTSGSPRSGTQTLPGGRVTVTNQPLRSMIRTAYGANDLEVVGGPDWIDRDRWDVLAAAAPDSPADAPWQAMLKAFLIERFRLRAHFETRERPIYRLVFVRSDERLGPDIRPTACPPDNLNCGRFSANTNGIKSGTITGVSRTLAQIATGLSDYAERRVFDATGSEKRYDFELRWDQETLIFTAVQEQLGLKLEPASGPLEVLFIDGVEKPTPE